MQPTTTAGWMSRDSQQACIMNNKGGDTLLLGKRLRVDVRLLQQPIKYNQKECQEGVEKR